MMPTPIVEQGTTRAQHAVRRQSVRRSSLQRDDLLGRALRRRRAPRQDSPTCELRHGVALVRNAEEPHGGF